MKHFKKNLDRKKINIESVLNYFIINTSFMNNQEQPNVPLFTVFRCFFSIFLHSDFTITFTLTTMRSSEHSTMNISWKLIVFCPHKQKKNYVKFVLSKPIGRAFAEKFLTALMKNVVLEAVMWVDLTHWQHPIAKTVTNR